MRKFDQIRDDVEKAIKEHEALVDSKRAAMEEAEDLAAASRAAADTAFTSDVEPLEAAALEITAKRNERAAVLAKSDYEEANKSRTFNKRDYLKLVGEIHALKGEDVARIAKKLKESMEDIERLADELETIDRDIIRLEGLIERNTNMTKEEIRESNRRNSYDMSIGGHYYNSFVKKDFQELKNIYKNRLANHLVKG